MIDINAITRINDLMTSVSRDRVSTALESGMPQDAVLFMQAILEAKGMGLTDEQRHHVLTTVAICYAKGFQDGQGYGTSDAPSE